MDEGKPLFPLLRAAVLRFEQQLTRALAPHGVTVSEWAMLAALYDAGAVPPSVLAERVGITRGAVTRLVDRLRARGLMVRAAGGADARMRTIALTGAGARLIVELKPLIDRCEASAIAAVSPKAQAQLAQTLHAIAKSDTSG